MNIERRQVAADLWTKAIGLSDRPAYIAASKPYPPSIFIIITQARKLTLILPSHEG